MAGQSVGMVNAIQPVAEILEELKAQAIGALRARGRPPGGAARAE
jgi:NAD(P)H-dependent flavin oxidoreductase YrpB (nitropropane dioxygenase family)